MSVVIVGGNECMERRYMDICRQYNCKAKIYVKKCGKMEIGEPDLMVFFTDTVSHKMVQNAKNALKGSDTEIAHCHSSSSSALKRVLEQYAV